MITYCDMPKITQNKKKTTIVPLFQLLFHLFEGEKS